MEDLAPRPLTYRDLREPTEAQLSAALERLVARVVVADTRAVRREDQLREIVHGLLLKIDSDREASLPGREGAPVAFQAQGAGPGRARATAAALQGQFRRYFQAHRARLFHADDADQLRLDDATLCALVEELAPLRILGEHVDGLAKAFQIFRAQALKSGEGQFLTPQRIIRPCVMAMGLSAQDRIIDPACGSGGFLVEALRQAPGSALCGVDKDPLAVKLATALLTAAAGARAQALLGDAVRPHLWGPPLRALEGAFTVVLTNPPFGEALKISAADAGAAGFSITQAAAGGGEGGAHADLEIGLVFLELARTLLAPGGRLGIVLPETYFFSHRYRWLPGWLQGRLVLRGMMNIAMEAFEEFCRAKTNFYIFERVGEGASADAPGPAWLRPRQVMVSTAPTCGISRGGRSLPQQDDQLLADALALQAGRATDTLRFVPEEQISLRAAVPVYYDRRPQEAFRAALAGGPYAGFTGVTLGELQERGLLEIGAGHGSPSADQRAGEVPYIKVSDLRAGLVNINPTNRVPREVAERHWRGAASGLRAFDLLSPERSSKNIGDFCVLLPGQERVLLTKEILVLRPGPEAYFDPFFLLWALTLKIVRAQWRRVVFMQTNREDVGARYLEIAVPLPAGAARAAEVSEPFRRYYLSLSEARAQLAEHLARADAHHFFIAGAAEHCADPAHQ